MDESGSDGSKCHRKLASGRNIRGLQPEWARVLHEALHMPALLYGRKRKDLVLGLCTWANLRGFLGIRRIDKIDKSTK